MGFQALSAAMGVGLVSVSAMAAVTPPVTSGLVMGLDASNVTAVGGSVTSWNDQSGSGNHALQATVTAQPTLSGITTPTGLATIDFDGTDDYLDTASSSAFNSTSGMTWFTVFHVDVNPSQLRLINAAYGDINPTATTTPSTAAWAAAANGSTFRALSRNTANSFIGATTASSTINTNDFFIGGGRVEADGDVLAMVVNGAGTATTANATGATTSFDLHNFTRVGAGTQSQTNPALLFHFDGQLAEILVYNRALTDEEITSVNTYLYEKHLAIPEPASVGLMGAALLLLAPRRRGRA